MLNNTSCYYQNAVDGKDFLYFLMCVLTAHIKEPVADLGCSSDCYNLVCTVMPTCSTELVKTSGGECMRFSQG